MLCDFVLDEHIVNIVQNQKIFEQSELQKTLKTRGYKVSQATLSRCLKKLKIAKVGGIYKIIDFSHSSLPIILDMQISEFGIIVLHTEPGKANSLTYFIDQKHAACSSEKSKHSKILGTLAGDDTIFLAVKNKTDLKDVVSLMHEEFPYLKQT